MEKEKMAEPTEISSGMSEGSNKKQKTTAANNNEDDPRYVLVKFVDQRDKVTRLKVKRNSTFGAAFQAYREANNLDSLPNFVYNGSRVNSSLTPAELNFRNGEQIDVYAIAYGG